MTKKNASRVVAGLVPAAALAAGAWLFTASDRAPDAPGGPHVSPEVLATALASRPPIRPTMTDEIEHFRARLASRPDEAFSHRSLAAAHLLRFRAYGSSDDLVASQRHLDAAATAGPSPQDRATQAALHLARHEFTSALEAARTANRTVRGTDPAIQLRLFDTYLAAGRTDEARAVLTLPLDTASAAWASRRARILDMEGEVGRARDLFRDVVRNHDAYAQPAAVRAWATVELGHFEHHAGDPARAVELYLDALELLPGSPAALEGLAGIALGEDGDLEAAAALLRRALAHGGHLDLLPDLADVEDARGEAEEASRLREEFVSRATSDSTAERLYRRPLALMLAGEPGGACRALALAAADLTERRDAGAWDALAWSRFHTGDLDGAWDAAQRAVAFGTPEPPTALRAAVIARAHGDETSAVALIDVAREGAGELSPGEAEVLASLARGGVGSVPSTAEGCAPPLASRP